MFDGLRGLAILAVFSYHAAEFSRWLGDGIGGRAAEAAGPQAVITFFVISGFLLYRPFVAARARGRPVPSTVKYGRRRALRILPAYWTILTLLAVFPGIVGVFTSDWWRYYGYLQLYSNQTRFGGIAVAWTLCIEVTFYIALPVWAWTVRRLPGRNLLRSELVPLGAIAAAGVVVQLLSARRQIGYALGVSLAGQCTWLAIGMAFAAISAIVPPRARIGRAFTGLGNRSGLCWIGSALAFAIVVALVPKGGLLGLITTVETRQSGWRTLAKIAAEGTCVALFVLPAVFGSVRQVPRRVLGWRVVVWLGVISYSFYLLHLTVIEFIALGRSPSNFSTPGIGLESHQGLGRSIALFTLSFGVTALLATVSYRFIELPFLRRKES